ncbi:MAG TPA: DinB family protein [Dehalococcoidia bacterium]|nr:DinB family protein [Dehalococcoidia bacterium]
MVDEIADHRARFETFCRSLSPEELARDVPESEWQVQDYIAHLATIDQTVTRWFAALAAGERPPGGSEGGEGQRFDIDRWNNGQVERRRGLSVDELLSEAADKRAQLLTVMERLSDEVVDGDIYFPGDAHRPPMNLKLEHYLVGWAKHDPIHVGDMLRALPERQSDPELTNWLEQSRISSWPPRLA